MRFTRFVTIAVGVAFLLPGFASAQRGARMSPPSGAARRSSASSFARSSRRSTVGPNSFFSNSLNQISSFPSNGLGLNGINTIATQNIGAGGAIDPATQWRLALAQRIRRNGAGVFPGGGYYLLSGGGYGYPADYSDNEGPPPDQGQPQQQEAPAPYEQPAMTEDRYQDNSLPDVGQFTLILRNGSQIEALAFSRVKEGIVYITQDGSRKTLPLSDLDVDATLKLNQERGTPLQLPL